MPMPPFPPPQPKKNEKPRERAREQSKKKTLFLALRRPTPSASDGALPFPILPYAQAIKSHLLCSRVFKKGGINVWKVANFFFICDLKKKRFSSPNWKNLEERASHVNETTSNIPNIF